MGISIIAILSAILFFIFFVAIKHTKIRTTIGIIFGVIFALSICLIVVNEKEHLGMKKVTTTTETNIESVVPGSNILVVQNIDKAGNKVVGYRVNGKKDMQTSPKKQECNIKIVQDDKYKQPVMKKEVINYKYCNKYLELLFKYPNQHLKTVKMSETFYVSDDFKMISADEMKQMMAKFKK